VKRIAPDVVFLVVRAAFQCSRTSPGGAAMLGGLHGVKTPVLILTPLAVQGFPCHLFLASCNGL
jgi:hypothetical protein